ncbi:MAG: ammonium transporter [Nitrospinae bacterium]|nr:ammonium transporter [Nitrospinota bacterium]
MTAPAFAEEAVETAPATETAEAPAAEAPAAEAVASEAVAVEEAPAAEAAAEAPAEEAPGITPAELKVIADTMWLLIAGMLVFFMNTGFAMLEAGLCRQKNTVNILSKNVIVFGMASLSFWLLGWGFMYGEGNPFIGLADFMLSIPGEAGKVPKEASFFFQLVFAATAATIVSGAVAERIKYPAFFVFSFLLVAFIYPVTGHWTWGGGWLFEMGFGDFAGSTVVHSVGGWAALTGAIILGPRLGKFTANGVRPIPGHNQAMAALGMFILWFGWFGFNPGSQLAADAGPIAHITVTTNMAAAAGLLAATLVSYLMMGKPDLSMAINGALAGLVAITAGCDGVSVAGSVIIGLIGGAIVVVSVTFFDKIKIDDPVGALSVHLVNGIWGTLAVGLFNTEKGLLYGGGIDKLVSQVIGIVSIGAYVVIVSAILWFAIKAVMGLRVSSEEEYEGLDLGEHGMEAYPDFSVRKAPIY